MSLSSWSVKNRVAVNIFTLVLIPRLQAILDDLNFAMARRGRKATTAAAEGFPSQA